MGEPNGGPTHRRRSSGLHFDIVDRVGANRRGQRPPDDDPVALLRRRPRGTCGSTTARPPPQPGRDRRRRPDDRHRAGGTGSGSPPRATRPAGCCSAGGSGRAASCASSRAAAGLPAAAHEAQLAGRNGWPSPAEAARDVLTTRRARRARERGSASRLPRSRTPRSWPSFVVSLVLRPRDRAEHREVRRGRSASGASGTSSSHLGLRPRDQHVGRAFLARARPPRRA